MAEFDWNLDGPVESSGFQTDWFVVRAAGQNNPGADEALEKLCHTYWYPLYAYARRKGHGPEDAQDLTQEFFARLLERPWLRDAHPSKGRFRSFLLASMNHFMANEWRRSQTQKRGGGREIFSLDAVAAESCYRLEPAHEESPDKLYERRWAKLLFDRVLAAFQEECKLTGKGELFEELKETLDGGKERRSYGEIATRLRMTEAAVKKAAQRLRERYGTLLREEVASTLASADEVDGEIRHLFLVLHA